jgi:uncharacterized repeat protein (TIGR01451 family)
MRVEPRDTVHCFDVITVSIEFENATSAPLSGFEVQAFFPNEIEKYCRLLDVVYATEKNIPVITDPGRNRFVLWQIGNLQVGKHDSVVFRLFTHWPPHQTVFFTYTASARANGTRVSEVSYFHTFFHVPICPGSLPDIGISKGSDKAVASVGDEVNFFLNIFNASADTAYNVVVEDSIPAGFAVDFVRISHPFLFRQTRPNGVELIRWFFSGEFLPGANARITIPTKVVLNPVKPTVLINQCEIASETPEVNNTNNRAELPITIVPKYDLRLTYSGEKEKTLAPNAEEPYTLAISNLSTVRVENFGLAVTLDDGLIGSNLYTIMDVSDGGTAPDDATIRWRIAALDSGRSITRSFRLKYDRVGANTRGRCVSFFALVDTTFNVLNTTQRDLNPADNQAGWRRCFNDAFDLALETTPDNNKPAAPVNQPQTYKLEFTNHSLLTLPAFTLRAELQPVAPTVAGNINISNVSPGGTTNGLQVTWTIASLGPNLTDSRTFEATITGINAGGTFGFTLRGEVPVFAGESDTTNNRRTWETRASVVTNLVVVDVAATPAQAAINGTAQIRIDYANRGSLNKDNAVLRAIIAVTPNAQIFSIPNSGGGAVDAGNRLITWTIPSLPANAGGTRSFDLRFDNVVQAADYSIKILGVIDRHDAADPAADNRDSVNVRLAALPQLFLSDIALTGRLESDQTLIYTFTYGNTGTFAATSATLDLNMPQATVEWTDAAGQALSQAPHLNLGDLPPGFQAPMTVRMKIINRENLLRQFGGRAAVDLIFNATLAATNAPPPISKSRTDQLPVPQLVEGFFLTHNTFRPETQGEVEIHFDVTKDANVGFKIYNVAGELVRSLAPKFGVLGSRVRQLWDGRNDTGERVASGLYFIFAEADYKSERPYRKLIVVR